MHKRIELENQPAPGGFFEAGFVLTAVLRPNGVVAEVNRAAFESVPVGRGAAVGKPFWQGPWWYDDPAKQQEIREAIARTAAGETIRLITTVRSAGNHWLQVDLSLRPVRDDTGRVDWILAEAAGGYDSRAAQDELYRLNRELEERIAERTELMRLMIESSAEAVVTIDRHGIIKEWNGAAERIFGWPRDQMIGGRLSEFIIPHRYREAHEAGLKRFLATGQGTVLNRTIELSALNSAGEEFPIELSVWPVRCAEGYRFSAFLRDITERKRAMQDAAETAERALRFRTVLFELARMDKTDYKGSLLRILRTAAYTLGLGRMVFGRFEEREDDVALRPEIIYRAESDDTVPESELGGFGMSGYPQYYAAIISNRPVVANDAWTDPATVEFRDHYLAPLGITSMLDVPVWLDGRVVAVVCHEHMGTARTWTAEEVGFALSIGNLVALTLEAANRTQAEADLRQAEAEVRKALAREQELNELKSRFVSMTSHEFRTPLTAILSSTELLEAYGERLASDKKAELLGMIKTAVKNMTRMLEEVLFIGKSDTGHLQFNPQPTDVDDFCEQLLKEVRTGVGREHDIEFTATGHPAPALVDTHLLRQIILNLISNGIKFSPKGSTVSLVCTRDAAGLVFEVADRGVGIPPEDRANLFNTFHRARNVNNIQGTGLGLAIVKKCIELHGGDITYTSELGKGTRFLVRIPLRGEHDENNPCG
ncbi:ATP-binding protein [Methylocaldum sp. RMAD-M]|uniref:PAS domain-containing sensor histidine kinase n=1 Tax=Methylocaldum sp. RMAD-M TaxID=2806557 RepID=UPI000A32A83C|nr:ATP-binding protein [Methylocaldum sp. RMAD-M]MBP1152467.1 PAS domain S-box-containing protein [Methylocaldum sp. RMAD-M]